ncbi:MAG: methionine adenosyltransferase [Methanobacteriota archaeon]|nr:MAG: methionine adenosyltransferase [Euryarchaeota archaeon]
MKKGEYLFTSESVTEGHPDKIADQISDAILDNLIAQDPDARVACETLVTSGLIFVAGEITTTGYADIPTIARETLREIGYTNSDYGIDCDTCGVITSIHEQSPDIAMGVNNTPNHEQGAGDQGLMFGYATNETPEYMPLPITLAHKLTKRLAEVRKDGTLPYLRPDGKSLVTLKYKDNVPVKTHSVVIAAQHSPDVSVSKVRKDIIEHVIKEVIPPHLLGEDTTYHINATGRFVIGGPQADTGLTGRKIIVDTYGGVGSHGGGCFSGKDPTKVDRSGSYAARYVAKNIVAAGLADRCEIQIAYSIGVAKPVSIMIDTDGTSKIPEEKILELVKTYFDITPRGIISHLKLKRPIYKKTACYGHFGRNEPEFTWERVDMVDLLREEAGLD